MTHTDHRLHYHGKIILVTGGAGAIGGNLTRALSEAGAARVIVLDDLSSALRWSVPSLPNVLFVEGSILDEVQLKRVFSERPQIVFHLAALFANQNSIDHPETDLMVNGMGTLKMLEYSNLLGVERFVFASSSSSFYTASSPLPLTEDDVSLHLSTPYQITKMLGELYCNFYHHYHGLPTVRPRFFNSYGPGEIPGQYRNVIPNFIYLALQGKPLPITGTGEDTRDFTYVGDHVDGLMRAGCVEQAVGEAFNFGSGEETRIAALAALINELTGNSAGVIHMPQRRWDNKTRRWASIQKARDLIGYHPTVALRDGLIRTIEWFRAHWDMLLEAASFEPGMSSAVRGFVAAERRERPR